MRVLVRGPVAGPDEVSGDLGDPAAMAAACTGIETVFHCAGYAHAFGSGDAHEARRHWVVNFEGSRCLGEAAGRAGVRRLVFLSSVKAMGEPGAYCVDEDWPVLPESPYGRAKRAAEEALLEAGLRFGMGVTNLRLAMVYGAGGRGNLERMGALVRRGWFPPLPETGNCRSLVHVSDVIAALRQVAEDERAAGRCYIVAHQHAPSGRALYDALRRAADLPERAWSIPLPVLESAAALGDWLGARLGRRLPLDGQALGRLLDSACYRPIRIERELGWKAQVDLERGLREMLSGI